MHALRQLRHLTRFLLVWFALYLGAAAASPLVAPQSFDVICSGAGMVKLVLKTADGGVHEAKASAMDCPLCAPGGAPPAPSTHGVAAPVQPLAYVLRAIPAARIAALTAAPLPARGPPPSLL
ncbi:DUF2946 family protein [Xylophilus sp. ASV27]|uniref:DUF2946 family protein n=1 Tax=Xylophilus sp. ASV27 TaxID=2795129 RepID=UPI0018ED7B60|nr:DUF2946 family protein [Xylophilus sp. ASV27]